MWWRGQLRDCRHARRVGRSQRERRQGQALRQLKREHQGHRDQRLVVEPASLGREQRECREPVPPLSQQVRKHAGTPRTGTQAGACEEAGSREAGRSVLRMPAEAAVNRDDRSRRTSARRIRPRHARRPRQARPAPAGRGATGRSGADSRERVARPAEAKRLQGPAMPVKRRLSDHVAGRPKKGASGLFLFLKQSAPISGRFVLKNLN